VLVYHCNARCINTWLLGLILGNDSPSNLYEILVSLSWLHLRLTSLDQNINFIFRSESKKAMESETNVVDRAVANLMFNEIDFSGREFSSAASVNSDEGVTGDTQPPVISKPKVVKAIGPPNYSLNQSKIQQVSHQPILPGDAEVPTLAQRDP
jgi:hypothetical protein